MPRSTARNTQREVREHPRVTEGRPLQYSDLDRQGQRAAAEAWKGVGMVKSRLGGAMDTARAASVNPENTETHRLKNSRELANLAAVADIGVTDKPLTITGAAGRRAIWSNRAAKRAQSEESTRRTLDGDIGITMASLPVGTGWYFRHADDIDRSARAYGHETVTAINASGAMSPQNSPENEKAAVTELMKVHSHGHSATAKTKRGAHALGLDNPGDRRLFSEMSAEHINEISNAKMAEHIETSANLSNIGKGSTGLKTGVGVLRGDVSAQEIGANSAKVPSYLENIRNAHAADANVRSEYYRRVHEVYTDKPYFEQPTLFGEEWEKDPWGHAQSTAGILNPRGNTAEDTWMQSISLGQKNETAAIPTGKRSGRLGKVLGSNAVVQSMPGGDEFYPTPPKSKKVSGDELRHAMNNAATIKAGEDLSAAAAARGRNVGAGLPSVAVQETAWTEYRIAQGKDPLWEKAAKPPAETGIPDSGKVYNPKKKSKSRKTEAVLQSGEAGKWVQDRLL